MALSTRRSAGLRLRAGAHQGVGGDGGGVGRMALVALEAGARLGQLGAHRLDHQAARQLDQRGLDLGALEHAFDRGQGPQGMGTGSHDGDCSGGARREEGRHVLGGHGSEHGDVTPRQRRRHYPPRYAFFTSVVLRAGLARASSRRTRPVSST